MKSITEEFEKLTKEYQKAVDTLRLCAGLEECVSHVFNNTIFCKDATLEESLSFLREFSVKHGKYKMRYYDMNCGRLAFLYGFEKFELVLLCTDVENALQKVGNGKCRLETVTEEKQTVICDI